MSFTLPLTQIAQSDLPWKSIAQSLQWASWMFETYLSLRQYPNYSRPEPPAALKSHFNAEVYAKSQAYGRDKARFSLVKSLYDQVMNSALIHFDMFAWAWEQSGQLLLTWGLTGDRQILHSIGFATIMAGIASLPSLPFEYYYTFFLEEKHGFNKTTKSTFILDLLKGWLVGFAFGAPMLSGFLLIVRHAGENFIYYLMAFFLVFQLLLVALYPLVIQPLFNKLSPLPSDSPLRARIENLAGRLKFPLKHLYQIDGSKRSSHSNAYFYGLPWAKHIVIFDTLIDKSSEEEVEAVLAHELGHWDMSHPTKLLLVSQIHVFLLLSSFPPFLHSRTLLPSFGFPVPTLTNAWRPPILPTFVVFNFLLTPLESTMQFAMNAITRFFEYQADEYAVKLGGTMGERLGKALTALHVENLSTIHVDWLYSAYHHSHPTLPERLRAMEKMEGNSYSGVESKKEL